MDVNQVTSILEAQPGNEPLLITTRFQIPYSHALRHVGKNSAGLDHH